jgi:hypothetical protein
MPHPTNTDFRQQRAIDAIDRASADLAIAIKTHAPDTKTVRQAQQALGALIDSVKAAIMKDGT